MTLGLNILGDRGVPTDRVLDRVKRLDANYHLVMNNDLLVAQVQPYCRKGVIYRWHPNDDNAQDRTNATERVNELHAKAPPGALIYMGNEPNPTQRLADWSMEALNRLEQLGRRGVFLNFSTGVPEPHDWPRFKPLLERIYDGGHILGLHEYFDRRVMAHYPYHVGRFLRVFDMMGSRTPEIVITETGAAIGFDPFRGWAVTMVETEFADQLNAAATIWARYGINATIFAEGSYYDDWGSFVPSDRVINLVAEHNRKLSTYKAATPPPVVVDPKLPATDDSRWEWMLAVPPAGFVNFRSTPAVTTSNKLGEIHSGTPIRIIRDDAAGVREGTKMWRPVSPPNGKIGWVRDDVITVRPIEGKPFILNSPYGSNLRETPNGKIISTIPKGSELLVSIPLKKVLVGAHEWALAYYAGRVGWIARVMPTWEQMFSTSKPPAEESPKVMLDVPYASQWGHPSKRTGMCGAACVWMVAADDRNERSVHLPNEITVDSIANYMGLVAGAFASIPSLTKALVAYGVGGWSVQNLTINTIIDEIDAGYPVIVLLDYGFITERWDKDFYAGHFLVAVGYDDERIYFNDPDYTGVGGKQVGYKRADVIRALADNHYSGNRPNQGIMIRYYSDTRV